MLYVYKNGYLQSILLSLVVCCGVYWFGHFGDVSTKPVFILYEDEPSKITLATLSDSSDSYD